jgi:hypothetical protein
VSFPPREQGKGDNFSPRKKHGDQFSGGLGLQRAGGTGTLMMWCALTGYTHRQTDRQTQRERERERDGWVGVNGLG